MTIPRTADDLTPEWCSDALGRSITTVTREPLGVGMGLVGQLYRLALDGPDGASTIVAKLAAPTDEGRFVATVLNMYGREARFYEQLSSRTTLAHPVCYHSQHDPETQDSVLLLEDVAPRGRLLDQIAGCSIADARPAIRALANLHACFWDDPALDEADWLLRLTDDPYPGAVAFAYETAWPRLQEFFPELITERVREFGDGYAARIPALFAKLCEPPLVLAHGDWRLDNLFFTPAGEVIAVDWQLIDRSVGPRDLAYLVTESVNVAGPDDYEAAFATYLDDLAEHDVRPDPQWAFEMYRYGTMLGFVYPVIAAGALTIEDPRHVELCRAMLIRGLTALDALDAFDLPL
jgi:Phosphotransferase enzyme family